MYNFLKIVGDLDLPIILDLMCMLKKGKKRVDKNVLTFGNLIIRGWINVNLKDVPT
jgi:hypothetical protein